jgi:hypothetical protein
MDWFQRESLRGPAAEIHARLAAERLIRDTSSARDLEVLRRDVARIASDMDDPRRPPPMFWSGIPWPEPGPQPSCDYQLVISVGGTKTEFALMRLARGKVYGLDPESGLEVSEPEKIERIKQAGHMPTPKFGAEVETGEALVAAMVRHFRSRFGHRKEALERCEAVLMSWGFPHRVIRTGPRLAGGLTARITSMTKDQAGFTRSLEGKDINVLFDRELRSQLGWSRPIAVANDTVMALHYFLDPSRRARHARVGLFINGTGVNFSAAEPYGVRPAGFISRPGEDYIPERVSTRRPLASDETSTLFFVNYETGSIELQETRTRFDTDPDYPLERNVLAGGSAFPRSLRDLTREFLGPAVFERLREAWNRAQGGEEHVPGAPLVADLAQGAGREILRGLEDAEARAAQLQVVARAIIARSALHAAMVLAAVTHRTGFGKGAGGFPDLLGMEGSVWKTPGYQELVKSTWQDLVGGDRLAVDLAAEPSYNASLSGPLYLAAIHHPKDGTP